LEIIFLTKAYRGSIAKRPALTTNEGDTKKNVQIRANVIQNPDSAFPLVIKPWRLDLSQVGDKTVKKVEFIIRNRSNNEAHLNLIDAPENMFKIKLPETIKGNSEAKASVEIRKEFLTEEFEKSFTFTVENRNKYRYTVPIYRSIRIPKDKNKPATP